MTALYPAEGGSVVSWGNPSDVVVVVGVVGTGGGAHHSKATLLNQVLGRNVFQERLHVVPQETETEPTRCWIDCYHDPTTHTVFLCASTIDDTSVWESVCEEETISNILHKGVRATHTWLAKWRSQHAVALLFLFHVCHSVVVFHEGLPLQLRFIRLLRALRMAKQAFSPILSAALGRQSSALPCDPPLLSMTFFLEAMHPTGFLTEAHKRTMFNALESQACFLVRKCLQTTTPAATLCTPNAKQFTLLLQESSDPTLSMLMSQAHGCEGGEGATDGKNATALREFFEQQIASVRRLYKGKKHSELPTAQQWCSAAQCVRDVLWSRKDESRAFKRHPLERLESVLDTDFSYSQARCAFSLPMAREAYNHDLPPHYGITLHKAHLERARAAYDRHGRGVAAVDMWMQLEAEFDAIFQSRRGCDAESLTGRPCSLLVHDTDVCHSTGFHSITACSCGRTVVRREDPFTWAEANETVYRIDECCDLLLSLPLPHPTPRPDPFHQPWSLYRLGSDKYYCPSMGLVQDGFLPTSNFLLPLMVSADGYDLVDVPSNNGHGNDGEERGKVHRGTRGSGRRINHTKRYLRWLAKRGGEEEEDEVSRVLWLGFEYQSVQGHRFMLRPESVTHPKGDTPVSTPSQLLGDLPLFIPCACCRPSCAAQLMRVFVVTPPVGGGTVVLNPCIQFAMPARLSQSWSGTTVPPIVKRFLFGWDGVVRLPPSTTVVLRLPFVYYNDRNEPLIQVALTSPYMCTWARGSVSAGGGAD